MNAPQTLESEIQLQRERVAHLKQLLTGREEPAARHLMSLADQLVHRSVWLVGGDGWAYQGGGWEDWDRVGGGMIEKMHFVDQIHKKFKLYI